ncbi:hypothetical protein Ahy_A08g038768 isoform D [Arachis hypogaea]|uniref:Uncharacterized protein n=1 Tax=Arachis hypogaea TaxID=3818 RepID=A0A445BUB5_ARAHY|nr:hypothetical protein Ahy_A08g038768 isoform D [Arachis hypogaea]
MPPSVALRHYHRRLVVRASSSFKNRSFFFLDLVVSVPGIHLLYRAPAAVRRALSHHRLRLVVADSSNPPPSSELCSSPGLCLRHDSAPLFSDCLEEKPISIPVSFLRKIDEAHDLSDSFISMYDSKITLSQLENVHCHVERPAILRYKDQFKEAIFLAFDSTSWKVLFSLNLVDNGSEVILFIYHGYSLKLFVKYNIQFYGVSKSFFRISDKDNHTCGLGFSDLVSQIGSMSFDSTGLHWRPLFEEFEKSTFSDKDTCNFGFEYTLKEITVQAVTWPTMILCGIDNIRDLFGPKVDLGLIKKNSICRLGIN